jgi:hypothetical protein
MWPAVWFSKSTMWFKVGRRLYLCHTTILDSRTNYIPQIPFLGAFAKLRKAILASSCVCLSTRPSFRPSVRVDQLGSYWTDFYETWYLSIYRKYAEKIEFLLKSDKSNGTSREEQYAFLIISRSVLLWTRSASERSCRENRKTYFMFVNYFSKIVPIIR